jgi:hypothetical protein
VFLAIFDHLFNPETRDFSEEVLALACASKQDFNGIYDRVQSASHFPPSTGNQNCRCGTFSIELLNSVLRQGDLPIKKNRYLDFDALGYCTSSKNHAAVVAIAKQRTGSALQPAEKDYVHGALLWAEMHEAPSDVKRTLRALCPEIIASVQEALDRIKKNREDKEQRQRERERKLESRISHLVCYMLPNKGVRYTVYIGLAYLCYNYLVLPIVYWTVSGGTSLSLLKFVGLCSYLVLIPLMYDHYWPFLGRQSRAQGGQIT